jgi:hypothetical protein
MKYLCICYYNEAAFKAMTPEMGKELGEFCAPHDAQLKAIGKVFMIGSLGMQDQTKVLKGGAHPTVENGPYARTANPMGAFFIVEAESMDEAVDIAKLHPGAHIDPKWLGEGAIEVWPLESLEEVNR